MTAWRSGNPEEVRELAVSFFDPALGMLVVGGFDFDGDDLPDLAAALPSSDELLILH